MRRYGAAMLMAGAVILGGCGGSTSTAVTQNAATSTKTERVKPSVVLHLDTGSYSVTSPDALVSGTATPGAKITVNRHQALIERGHWRLPVSLSHGENTIEVHAAMTGHTPADETITITRETSAAERAEEAAARKQAYEDRAITIPYKELNKNAEAYEGKIVKYTGQIFQIQESGEGGGIMLVSVTDEEGFWTDHIYVDYKGHVKGAAEDMVTFYGKVVGSKSYETQAGGETYVPEVEAKYVIG